MARSDVIVIGAGHNGLTAAAYLARAGHRVLVLEATDRVGGLAAVDDLARDVACPAVFPTADRLHPSIVRDLGLQGHGLRIRQGGGTLLVGGDGGSLYAPPGGLPSGLGDRDREALASFERFLGRVGGALETALAEELPDIESTGIGRLADLLALGWRLRRLGRRDMPQAMRLLPMALRDVAEERFEDERLRAAIAWIGLQGNGTGPWAPGGALALLMQRPAWYGGLFPGPRFAAGAPLGEALAAAARAAGATVRTGARVTRIRVRGERVAGVALESGEEVETSCVVSGTDPRTTLLGLLEPGWLEPATLAAARNIRGAGAVSVVRFAVSEPPVIRDPAGGNGPVGRIQIGQSLRYQEEASDCVKYGRFPGHPVLELTLLGPGDGAGGGAGGRQAVHAWVQYTPRHLREGSWDDQRDVLRDLVITTIEEHAPGFGGSIEHADVLTPADIEARFGIRGGHPYHLETALDQALYMRPFPGAHDGRTPLAGLYLAGPGIHPGGGVTGLPGKLAARRVLADLKASRGR